MKILNMALKINDMSEASSREIDYFSDSTITTALSPSTKKEFFSLVRKANFIAIDSEYALSVAEKSLETSILAQEVQITDSQMSELPICPPFKCQWIELSYNGHEAMAPSIKKSGFVMTILGMLVNEVAPNLYDIFTLENHANQQGSINKFAACRNVSGLNPGGSHLQMFFAVWMKAINSGSLGIEDGEDVVMLPKENGKKDGKKKPHQIRRIVRIVPKSLKNKTEPIMNNGKVDFSHRWEVRGHWRRVAGMGKNREGNYEVRGLTWIKDFVKGPEELPLIQKLRWIPGQAS
jgi:hypothetical protein